jgi:hypothetical protein
MVHIDKSGNLKKKKVYIQGVPGGKVNILEGHSIGHSKPKSVYVDVLFQMTSERELLMLSPA